MITRRKKKPLIRVGRVTGKIRLSGEALEGLRADCWQRDKLACQECGVMTFWKPWYDGDPRAFDMAHIKSRGAGGSDTLDNVRTLCHACHMKEHAKGKRAS